MRKLSKTAQLKLDQQINVKLRKKFEQKLLDKETKAYEQYRLAQATVNKLRSEWMNRLAELHGEAFKHE